MYNPSPTPRRYTSRPEFRNNLRHPTGNFGDQRNLNTNLRETFIPKEYYENAKNVDELLAEIKSLNKQLYESQCEKLRINDRFQQCQNKLGKYHELASKYKEERNELSMRLYGRNIYGSNEDNVLDDSEMERELNRKNIHNDKIYVEKRRDDGDDNKSHNSSKSAENNRTQMDDDKIEEFALKLLEKIVAVKKEESGSVSNAKKVSKNNKIDHTDDNDDDVIKTKELEELEDKVSEFRNKLAKRKALGRRKASLQLELLQLQKELGKSNGDISVTNENDATGIEKEKDNTFGKHRSRFKTKGRRGLDDFETEYDNMLSPDKI